ncbi:FAD-binding protein [Pendulispora rubella]|uniref:FAD-binding protein n=1 Tax=Pendulispora rubella TaxID=2741070 RepID=A0ABZ2L3C8_9BACT
MIAYATGVVRLVARHARTAWSGWRHRGEIGNRGYGAESISEAAFEPHDVDDVPMGDSPLVPRRSISGDYAVEPTDLRALRLAVAWANLHRIPIRIHECGLSTNGTSSPPTGELHISMASCRHYRFEEKGTITVGAGVDIEELRATVASHGFDVRETVKDVVMVSGDGRVQRLAGSEEFRRPSGSMGRLGIAYELKLRIRRNSRVAPRTYPLGVSGVVAARSHASEPREADWIGAAKRLVAISARHFAKRAE